MAHPFFGSLFRWQKMSGSRRNWSNDENAARRIAQRDSGARSSLDSAPDMAALKRKLHRAQEHKEEERLRSGRIMMLAEDAMGHYQRQRERHALELDKQQKVAEAKLQMANESHAVAMQKTNEHWQTDMAEQMRKTTALENDLLVA